VDRPWSRVYTSGIWKFDRAQNWDRIPLPPDLAALKTGLTLTWTANIGYRRGEHSIRLNGDGSLPVSG